MPFELKRLPFCIAVSKRMSLIAVYVALWDRKDVLLGITVSSYSMGATVFIFWYRAFSNKIGKEFYLVGSWESRLN